MGAFDEHEHALSEAVQILRWAPQFQARRDTRLVAHIQDGPVSLGDLRQIENGRVASIGADRGRGDPLAA